MRDMESLCHKFALYSSNMSLLGLILSSSPYLRSALGRRPLPQTPLLPIHDPYYLLITSTNPFHHFYCPYNITSTSQPPLLPPHHLCCPSATSTTPPAPPDCACVALQDPLNPLCLTTHCTSYCMHTPHCMVYCIHTSTLHTAQCTVHAHYTIHRVLDGSQCTVHFTVCTI